MNDPHKPVRPLSRIAGDSAPSIWLEVKQLENTWLFELPPHSDQTISFGADSQADVVLSAHPKVPLLFYVERARTAVHIVPAYHTELRLNSRRIQSSERLAARSLVEFHGTRVELTLSEQRPENHVATVRVTDDERPTVAIEARPELTEDPPTEYVAPTRAAIARPSVAAEDPTTYVAPLLHEEPTEIMGTLPHLGWDEDAPPFLGHFSSLPVEKSVLPHQPESAETAAFDFADINTPADDALPEPLPAREAMTSQKAAHKASAALRLRSVLRDRPAVAAMAGAIAVVLCMLAALGIARTLQATPNVLRGPTPPTKEAQLESKPDVVERSPASLPASAPPPTSSRTPDPVDPKITSAAEHLVAGRHEEAQAMYQALASKYSENPSFETAARLLARRNSPACKNQLAPSCPEVSP